MVTQLLKWVGNKHKFAEEIVSYFPQEFNDYYEPFLGSGAVMAEVLHQKNDGFYLHFNHSYGSDVLPFLIDIFKCVRDTPDRLTDYYAKNLTDYNDNKKEKYEEIKARFNKDKNFLDFCLLSRTCYSGIIRFRKADGYMSTPVGPHRPVPPDKFKIRVLEWHRLIRDSEFRTEDFRQAMKRAKKGDVVYCDPPYTHSQAILYGAQNFSIDDLWAEIQSCKDRGVKVLLSINGTRESKKKDISVIPPDGLFERQILINCGKSMVDRLQNGGSTMDGEVVHDRLLLTW